MQITTMSEPTVEKSYSQKKMEELTSAASDLEKAAKEAPMQGQKRLLSALINYARMLNGMQYRSDGWNKLMKVLAKAEGVSLSNNAAIGEIRKAAAALRAGLGALMPAENDDDGKRDGLPITTKTGSAASSDNTNGAANTCVSSAPSVSPAQGVDVSL